MPEAAVATPPAKFDDSGRIRAIDPRHWRVLETLTPDDVSELPQRIAACRVAQQRWATRPLKEREKVLKQVLQRITDRADDLATVLQSEHGKSRTEAYFSEVMGAAGVVKTHLGFDRKWLKPEKVAISPLDYPGKKGRIEHRPRGVVALITPWNYPLALPMRTLVPALLAGNGVLFKPSEHSLLVGKAIAGLFEGLLPEGLLQLVIGGGEQGAALTSSPDIDAIVFTGSVRTGRHVARAAAETLVPVSLELGGKDAAIVCSDADLDRSAKGIAWAAFHNTGQNCAAIERVYVEDIVYDAFVSKLVEETKKLRVTGEPDFVEVGPLCNQLQFDIVEKQLADATQQGATVLCGGEPGGEGWTFQPTVLVDVPLEADLWQQETFGPLLPVRRVESVYDAADDIAASPYGLSCSVWTQTIGRGEEIARRCDTGMALVNNHAFTGSIPNAPWVGTKESGYGVTGSSLAMKFLTRPQLIVVDKSKIPDIWWFPFNENALELIKTALKSLTAPLGQQPGLLVKLLGLLGKRWK